MSTDPTKKKRRIMHSLTMTEISAVDCPAQAGARAVLMKVHVPNPPEHVTFRKDSLPFTPTPNPAPAPGRQSDLQSEAMTTEAIIKNATAFDLGREPVKFTKSDYDEAVLAIVKSERRAEESEAQALTRLMFDDRDPRMESLARAAMFAPKVAAKAAAPTVAKSAQDAAWEVMTRLARSGAQRGETVEMAMDRLLREGDAHMAAAADAYYRR